MEQNLKYILCFDFKIENTFYFNIFPFAIFSNNIKNEFHYRLFYIYIYIIYYSTKHEYI